MIGPANRALPALASEQAPDLRYSTRRTSQVRSAERPRCALFLEPARPPRSAFRAAGSRLDRQFEPFLPIGSFRAGIDILGSRSRWPNAPETCASPGGLLRIIACRPTYAPRRPDLGATVLSTDDRHRTTIRCFQPRRREGPQNLTGRRFSPRAICHRLFHDVPDLLSRFDKVAVGKVGVARRGPVPPPARRAGRGAEPWWPPSLWSQDTAHRERESAPAPGRPRRGRRDQKAMRRPRLSRWSARSALPIRPE